MKSLNLLTKSFLEGKKVIVRGDLDVAVSSTGVTEAFRLDALRDTLDYILRRESKVILIGHLGRPAGKIIEHLRLDPVAIYLTKVGYKVKKMNSILGNDVYSGLENLKSGEIMLLENLRFDQREEANYDSFSQELAKLGDLYVNECFATSHRAHASLVGIPKFLEPVAGLRLQTELETLSKILTSAEKPLVAIVGGVKLETKLPVISKFLSIADYVLLGGKLGVSYEGDNNYKVLVPEDYVGNDKEDIGPKTVKMFENVIKMAKTIVWNGPLGRFEDDNFIDGTRGVAKAVIESGAYSVVGGGDTIAALDKLKLLDKMDFASTGGGAMLDFIAGEKLPGLAAIGYYG